MRFGALVGVAALLLAILDMILMAAVDRRSRAAELRVLRVQGLPASAARRAAFVGHASIAVVAGIIGGVAAIASWLLVSSHLPIFATGAGLVRLALAPPWYAVVLPAFVGAAILAVTAAFAATDVSSVVRRNEERASAL
jgi:putative ABC transport system permease protein